MKTFPEILSFRMRIKKVSSRKCIARGGVTNFFDVWKSPPTTGKGRGYKRIVNVTSTVLKKAKIFSKFCVWKSTHVKISVVDCSTRFIRFAPALFLSFENRLLLAICFENRFEVFIIISF